MPMTESENSPVIPHQISLVIPVYSGETTLIPLVEEIEPLTRATSSPGGSTFVVTEVVLVFDNGSDGSADVIRQLEQHYPFVRSVWLSRNYGQHSATLAGMSATTSEWIVTLDEDGQHDPADIGILLDAAVEMHAPLVYARPTNDAPHGIFRNSASSLAKFIVAKLSGNPATGDYQSFRLILGEIGRDVAEFVGPGIYLDVALGWVTTKAATADVPLRRHSERESGYSTMKLLAHFLRLILSSGTRGLRLVSGMGIVFALAGLVLAVVFAVQRLADGTLPDGWASQIVVILISSGAILFALGVIAEYIGIVVNAALGKPPYLVIKDPAAGPLGRRRP